MTTAEKIALETLASKLLDQCKEMERDFSGNNTLKNRVSKLQATAATIYEVVQGR